MIKQKHGKMQRALLAGASGADENEVEPVLTPKMDDDWEL